MIFSEASSKSPFFLIVALNVCATALAAAMPRSTTSTAVISAHKAGPGRNQVDLSQLLEVFQKVTTFFVDFRWVD